MADNEDVINNIPSIRCRYCGQRNQIRPENGEARCGRCRLPLSDAPHKKFANLNKDQYIHPADRRALAASERHSGNRLGPQETTCRHRRIGHTSHLHRQRRQSYADAVSRSLRQTPDRVHDSRRRYAGSVRATESDR